MPDTIDFDATARRIAELTDLAHVRAELLRIWNARGAADIARIDTELATLMGATASGPYCKKLDLALRALDR